MRFGLRRGAAPVALGLCVMGALIFGGCLINAIGDEGSGGQGGTPTTTTGGTGCEKPSDCQVPSSCFQPTCELSICGSTPLPVMTPCGDGITQACDALGLCVGLLGRACETAGECQSGFCADNVCCGSACDGVCESCASPPAPGTCQSHQAGTDPATRCGGGVCDGSAGCSTGELSDGWVFPGSIGSGVERIVAAPGGGAVLAGLFAGTLQAGATGLTSVNSSVDVFIARVDVGGQVLWAKSFGGTGNDELHGLAVGADGRVALSGGFSGTVSFGGTPLVSAGARDHFVTVLDDAGAHILSQRFGDPADQGRLRVALAGNGDIVLAGSLLGTADFGGGLLTDAGAGDALLVRLSPVGAHLLSQRFGDGAAQEFSDVAVAPNGQMVAVGSMSGSADFGQGNRTSMGNADMVLAKFDSMGVALWDRQFGDGSEQRGDAVGVDAAGNIVLAGSLRGAADFGGGPLTSAGDYDVVIASFAADATYRYAARFGEVLDQRPFGIAVDEAGRFAVAGDLNGAADFGGGVLTANGLTDLFVAKFAADGTPLFSARHGDAALQHGRGVALLDDGQVWPAGFFSGTIDLGGGEELATIGPDAFWLGHKP